MSKIEENWDMQIFSTLKKLEQLKCQYSWISDEQFYLLIFNTIQNQIKELDSICDRMFNQSIRSFGEKLLGYLLGHISACLLYRYGHFFLFGFIEYYLWLKVKNMPVEDDYDKEISRCREKKDYLLDFLHVIKETLKKKKFENTLVEVTLKKENFCPLEIEEKNYECTQNQLELTYSFLFDEKWQRFVHDPLFEQSFKKRKNDL